MRKKGIKRLIAYVLTLCMVVTGLFVSDYSAIQAEAAESTTVYFYNSDGWTTVGAHAWSDAGDLTGGWGSTTATASEIGEGWVEVTIPSAPAFSVIFFDKNADANRSTVWFGDTQYVYATMGDKNYTSQAEAEAAMGVTPETPVEPETPAASTKVYFYNSDGWTTVGAHAWGDAGDLTGGWGSTTATASEIGEGWVEVTIPSAPAFNVIFFDKDGDADANRSTVWFGDTQYVYGTMGDKNYTSQAEAEAAMGVTPETPVEPETPAASTKVYFYNNEGWATVNAYVWGAANGEALGGWPGVAAGASDAGENWVEVEVPADPAFHVIFFNADEDSQRVDAYIENTTDVYATLTANYSSALEAEIAAGVATGTNIYFLNSNKWAEVGAYVYGDQGELLGGWGTTTAVAATELGGDWVKVTAAGVPPYSIIFFNKAADSERAELYLPAAENIYVTTAAQSYTSQADAEASMSGTGDGTEETTETNVYFLNTGKWGAVGAYIYGDKGELLGSWGTTTAEAATELGGDWLKVTVTDVPPYNIIFFNKDNDAERAELLLPSADNVYVTADGQSYTSQLEAEIAAGLATGTNVYFLNSAKWTSVGAYIYGDKGELLGGFANTTAVPATELGGDWVKVTVKDVPPYSIIFYNKDKDSERAELYLPAAENIYVTATAQSYTSKEDAEKAIADTSTLIYFLNYDGEAVKFDEVYAYAYANGTPVADAWPGVKASEATNLGENWWQVEIPANALITPFTVIFNDGAGNQIADVNITNYTGNYVTAKGDATLYATQNEAERSVGIVNETVVYYLNSEGWEDIAAYVYGDAGQVLGSWPGEDVEPATELGEKWVKVTVPAKPKFSIIFHEKSDTAEAIRAELLIQSDKQVYVAGCKEDGNVAAYGSQEEAELAMGMGDPSKMATLYFYNSRGWGDINGYVFREEDGVDITVGSGWPGKAAEEAEDIGENWWKVVVPRIPTEESPFYIIFNDGVNQTEDILIDETVNVYITAAGGTYPTPAEAEEAAANDTYDDGCEDGPNADLDGYVVNYNGAGAALPYVTYEAEAANTNAEVLAKATAYRESIQSEASGRQAVKLDATGEYVEFTLTESTNTLVLRYSMPDNASGTGIDASLSMYVNGTEAQDLALTSKYAWVYGGYPFNNNPNNGMAHRFFDETRVFLGETLPAGTTIRLQKDAGDAAEYYVVDFIECELVGAPLAQPENSLSVTDFGAVANDGQDDRAAFEACIEAAKLQDKEVWIPAGNFDLVEEEALVVAGVTIRGAGMWYTNLNGAGAAFKYEGTSKFFDFAMNGVSTVRDDSGDLAGFEGNGKRATNITIQNIWMEHMKVGVWSANTDGMVIQGCRIRNTYADGINLCSGTSNSTVRNNSLRNTGDDCIAIWPWLADCSGNTIAHNTIQVPTLANGVAIYGGGNNVVDSNYVADTINNGAGIVVGSEFDTAKGYVGTITVKNNVLDRCGSMQTDENYQIGAIWIWSSWSPMTTAYNVMNNTMNDCTQVGITIECNSELTGLNIQNNTINGAKNAVFEYLNGTGSGKLGNLTVSNIEGDLINDQAPNFILTLVDEDIVEDDDNNDDNTGDDNTDDGNDDEGDDGEEPGNKPGEGNKPGHGNKPGDDNKPGHGNKPGNENKPEAGNKPGDGNMPEAGNKPGNENKPEAGNKPGNDNKPEAGNKPGNDNKPENDNRPGNDNSGNQNNGNHGNGHQSNGNQNNSGNQGGNDRNDNRVAATVNNAETVEAAVVEIVEEVEDVIEEAVVVEEEEVVTEIVEVEEAEAEDSEAEDAETTDVVEIEEEQAPTTVLESEDSSNNYWWIIVAVAVGAVVVISTGIYFRKKENE